MESWKRFVPADPDATDEEKAAKAEECRLDEERLMLERQLLAASEEEVEQFQALGAKRKALDEATDSLPPKSAKREEVLVSDDSDSEPDMNIEDVGTAHHGESVESLLSLLEDAQGSASADDAATLGGPRHTILAPEEKTEVLLLVKHMLNICESDAERREKRQQLAPLISRLTDLLPSTQAFFSAHGWRGLKLRKQQFDPERLMKELNPLRHLEEAVLSAQAAVPKQTYAEAADQAVLKRTLFVAGLPIDAHDHKDEVTALFEGYGVLSQPIVLGSSVDTRLATTAVVQYRIPSSAAKAQNLHGILFRGQALQISSATEVQLTAFGILLPSSKHKEHNKRALAQPVDDEEGRMTLLVKGLPSLDTMPSASVDCQLVQLFRPYGPFLCALRSSAETAGCSAIIRYQNEQHAMSAIQRVNGIAFYDRRLVVHYATTEEVAEHGPLHPCQTTVPSASPVGAYPQIGGFFPGSHILPIPQGIAPVPVSALPPPPLFPAAHGIVGPSWTPRPAPTIATAIQRGRPGRPFVASPSRSVPAYGKGSTVPLVRPATSPLSFKGQRKTEIQSKKKVDSFLSDYEAFYAQQAAKEIEEYARSLAAGEKQEASGASVVETQKG